MTTTARADDIRQANVPHWTTAEWHETVWPCR